MAGNDANTLLLLHGEDLTDASPHGHTLTNNGVTVSSAQSKFGGKSLYFNGSARLLLDPIDFGANDFTVDWWEYVTSSASGARLCTQYTTETASIKLGGILLGYAGTAVYASSYISTGAWDLVNGANMFSNTLNGWVHWAIVRSGTTLTSYRNGAKFASTTISGAIACDPQYKTAVGDYRAGDAEPFIGYLDEFRVSNIARWTADFTPPDKEYETIPPPSAPESVRTALSIMLLWAESEGATQYNIYRDGTLIGTTSNTQYIDTTAEENRTYTYGITAVNFGGESAPAELIVYTRSGYFQYKPLIQTANFP